MYQQNEWQKFTWDNESLMHLICKARFLQGKLIGKMESLGYDLRQEANLETMATEIIKSAEIENRILNYNHVRSSLARYNNIKNSDVFFLDGYTESLVEAYSNAWKNYNKPLTYESLMCWNRLVSKEEKSFTENENSSYCIQENEIFSFIDWFNRNDNTEYLLKAGIAHYWLTNDNRFGKNRGLIARVISYLLLTKSDESSLRFYSLSAEILEKKKEYFNILEKTRNEMPDITLWMQWFLSCVIKSLSSSEQILGKVLYKNEFWNKTETEALNQRQKLVLNIIRKGFEDKLTSSKWAEITRCSTDTALRDIKDLLKKQLLKKTATGGRSTYYKINSDL